MLFFFGENFLNAFMDSKESVEAIRYGIDYIYVVSAFYVLMGTMNVFNGVLRGAGDMKVFMAATFTNFGLRLIFAHVLSATAMGPAGIWWSIPIGWGAGILVSGTRYASGKWKAKKLVAAEL